MKKPVMRKTCFKQMLHVQFFFYYLFVGLTLKITFKNRNSCVADRYSNLDVDNILNNLRGYSVR